MAAVRQATASQPQPGRELPSPASRAVRVQLPTQLQAFVAIASVVSQRVAHPRPELSQEPRPAQEPRPSQGSEPIRRSPEARPRCEAATA